jgi:hypothetical protein
VPAGAAALDATPEFPAVVVVGSAERETGRLPVEQV